MRGHGQECFRVEYIPEPKPGGPEVIVFCHDTPVYVELKKLFWEQFAYMQLLRSLGFAAENIYFHADVVCSLLSPAVPWYGVLLVVGDTEFRMATWPCDSVRMTLDDNAPEFCNVDMVERSWTNYLRRLQHTGELCEAQSAAIRRVAEERDEILACLYAKGITPPCHLN